MYYGHPVCWVLGETLEAARIGATQGRRRLRPAAVAGHDQGGHRGGELPGRPARAAPRRPGGGLRRAARTSSRASSSSPARSTSTWRPTPRWPASTRTGRSSSSPRRSTRPRRRTSSSHVLGQPYHEVTVQCLRMGGGFGGKEMQPHGYAAIAALGAVVTGRPVRVRFNRTQDITITGKRHGFHSSWKVGFDADGTDPGADRDADRGRRLEPGPVRAGAGAGRCATSTTPTGSRTSRCTGGSRRRTRRRRPRSAGSAGRRA